MYDNERELSCSVLTPTFRLYRGHGSVSYVLGAYCRCCRFPSRSCSGLESTFSTSSPARSSGISNHRKSARLVNLTKQLLYPRKLTQSPDANTIFDWRSGAENRRRFGMCQNSEASEYRASTHTSCIGDISSISLLGTTIVTLHTHEKTVELLDKKSTVYSSRPPLTLPGLKDHLTMLPYGSDLRECRKLIKKGTEQVVIPDFYTQQRASTRRLLNSLNNHPEQFYERLAWCVAAVPLYFYFELIDRLFL